MAKTETNNKKFAPVQFIGQVKQEGKKVTWSTRKETLASTVMVLIMVTIAAIFFFVTDWIISSLLQIILGL